ncbi:MAG: T9SS type A sorting domain-containing protein [Candidatus Cloacimonetes bacterium]|nr:T9SS type A sorting domain-containing protein [Candidatus Cloacimonadota bacterium]
MWDFDNDGTIDSNIQNPTYIYAEAGVYSVSLKITDGVTEITELKEDYITVNAVNADENEIAVVTRLNGNYPNPFTGETTISFSLSAENMEKAEVEIYNMKGQLVETFANLPITNSPNQQIIWNAEKQASGVYFYKLVVDGIAVDTKKMILLK